MRETRKIEVVICDGRHRSETEATEAITIDGKTVDLCHEHATEYRAVVRRILPPNGSKDFRLDNSVVREWAKANGVECPERGRIPAAVLAAYAAR